MYWPGLGKVGEKRADNFVVSKVGRFMTARTSPLGGPFPWRSAFGSQDPKENLSADRPLPIIK